MKMEIPDNNFPISISVGFSQIESMEFEF